MRKNPSLLTTMVRRHFKVCCFIVLILFCCCLSPITENIASELLRHPKIGKLAADEKMVLGEVHSPNSSSPSKGTWKSNLTSRQQPKTKRVVPAKVNRSREIQNLASYCTSPTVKTALADVSPDKDHEEDNSSKKDGGTTSKQDAKDGAW